MLELDSISYSFGKKSIFQDLSLQFELGKTYGIVGANGVGKTTLFRTISGFYKAQNGTISFQQKALHSTDVSFLPTSPFFYPYMNGMEYLQITQKEKSRLDRGIQLAETLHIPLDNLIDTYSTGMKKKLAFLARYVHSKKVHIYDEPFNGVDLESNEVLIKLLQKEREEKVNLISSHILATLFDICDEILHIEKGFIISHYQPEQFADLQNKIRAAV